MTSSNSTRTLLHTIDGPNGSASLYEVVSPGQAQPSYEVNFGGTTNTFKSMGEAYIEAGVMSGTPT